MSGIYAQSIEEREFSRALSIQMHTHTNFLVDGVKKLQNGIILSKETIGIITDPSSYKEDNRYANYYLLSLFKKPSHPHEYHKSIADFLLSQQFERNDSYPNSLKKGELISNLYAQINKFSMKAGSVLN